MSYLRNAFIVFLSINIDCCRLSALESKWHRPAENRIKCVYDLKFILKICCIVLSTSPVLSDWEIFWKQ